MWLCYNSSKEYKDCPCFQSSAVKITDQSIKEKKESAEMSESLNEKSVDLEANKGDQPDKPSVVKSLNAPVIEVSSARFN